MRNIRNDYLYCGEQFNGTTGLYYLGARYMNPSTGTFISMDKYQGTINDPISLHKYLYANANPVMYTDPTGYSSGTLAETIGTITVMDIINGIIVPNLGPALEVIA
ncbi:MAG TPA: RHS repeat-associated core domain-containing protein, partial [Tissierellaceae bacterium]|nr:RHS repeat-associated core domain-containing protein [Tissierellaceae bacterium]